jgi:hypothetical protein
MPYDAPTVSTLAALDAPAVAVKVPVNSYFHDQFLFSYGKVATNADRY